ncbi:TetR family transcriptional regulator [Aureimonas ureilytica]|uniref:TetR family transcriptional regulator n=1 Tax=Aureimonas ureilytica TaxID=401562 RepID=UPI000369EADE|nr:TetR family transcriptional regulator [Aureimonas ureilytica]
MRRTKAEAMETRCAILDAAEVTFFQNGVSRTTLAMIAEAAKVTRGAIYFHFANKNALFEAMLERGRLPQECFVQLDDLIGAADPLDRIRSNAVEALDFISTNARTQKILAIMLLRCEYVAEMEEMLVRLREADEEMLSVIRRAFQEAAQRGLMSGEWTAEAATTTLQCAMSGLITQWLRSGFGFDLVTTGRRMLQSLFESFRRTDES